MKSSTRVATLVVLSLPFLISCNSITVSSHKNERYCSDSPTPCRLLGEPPIAFPGADTARAIDEFEDSYAPPPPVFVGLALSGGGSRAANFSLAVMQELEKLGIMQHVTAISSTSGGGLAGAYYAINGYTMTDGSVAWVEAKSRFAGNLRTQWVVKSLLPWNLATTGLSTYDRSDLMVEILDKNFFAGQKFGDLPEPRDKDGRALPPQPRRPIWIANSTRADTGELFAFSSRGFRSIGSRIGSYPIGNAVMASAAFPGAFNSVTLRTYPLGEKKESYIHVFDGGPADNLGVESLLRLAISTARKGNTDVMLRHGGRDEWRKPAACLIIMADAYPVGTIGLNRYRNDPRGLIDNFVDFNFMQAFDHFLSRRRDEFLEKAGLDRPYAGDNALDTQVPGYPFFAVPPRRIMSEIELPLQAYKNSRPLVESIRAVNASARQSDGTGGAMRCMMWHLAFDNLSSFRATHPAFEALPTRNILATPSDAEAVQRSALSWELKQSELYRAKLRLLVSQIATDFNLTGPQNCSPTFLQDALYEAARIVVTEEVVARAAVCKWLKSKNLHVPSNCSWTMAPSYDSSFLAGLRPVDAQPESTVSATTDAAKSASSTAVMCTRPESAVAN